MSDILPQIEPEQSGQVTKLDVPFSSFMQHSFAAGQADSMFRAVSNTTEDQIDKNSNAKMLTAEEANNKYAVGELKFKQPINESLALSMSEREKTKMDENMFLYSGATKGRFLPGMAAGILGATANPLDFGSMFVPFVGESKVLQEGGAVAKALSRGLITAEAIAKTGIPVPKLVGSMAQATMWQGMAEVPKIYESHIENQPMPRVGADMLGQAAFAGILHGVGEGLKMLGAKTHEVMSKQAVNDFLQDNDISAHQYINMDEHVIAYQALQKEIQLRHETEGSVDLRKIAEEYKDKNLEYSVAAAIRMQPDSSGQQAIHTGATHWTIPEFLQAEGDIEPERGMWTNKGRFVTMEEAQKLHGLPESTHPTSENILYGAESVDEMSPGERKVYSDLLDKGYTDAEAMNTVRSDRKERMENAFFSKPEVQAEVQKLRQQAIDKWVADRKEQLKNPVPKEVQRVAVEKTVSDKDVQKYNGDMEHLNKSLDEDIEGLGGEPIEQKKNEQTGEEIIPPEHLAIDAATECIIKKIV